MVCASFFIFFRILYFVMALTGLMNSIEAHGGKPEINFEVVK